MNKENKNKNLRSKVEQEHGHAHVQRPSNRNKFGIDTPTITSSLTLSVLISVWTSIVKHQPTYRVPAMKLTKSLAKREGETKTTKNKKEKYQKNDKRKAGKKRKPLNKRKGRKQGQNNTKFKSMIFQRQHHSLCHTGIKKPFKYSFGNF